LKANFQRDEEEEERKEETERSLARYMVTECPLGRAAAGSLSDPPRHMTYKAVRDKRVLGALQAKQYAETLLCSEAGDASLENERTMMQRRSGRCRG
jgi:hypothetical protein